MASCFKASCMIYWLTWFFCLSYTLGIYTYIETYALNKDSHFMNIFMVMYVITIINFFMCIIGCIWLKCDITHIVCAVFFIVSVLGANVTLSVYGLVQLKYFNPPTAEVAYAEVKAHLRNLEKVPGPAWFVNGREYDECCGVYSFLDYVNENKVTSQTKLSNFQLPTKCCVTLDAKGKCSADLTNLGNFTKYPHNFFPICQNKTMAEKVKYHSEFKPARLANLQTCGCYITLYTHMTAVTASQFVFFMIVMAASVLMVVVYSKNLCRDRLGVNAGSSHSLDVDELMGTTDLKADASMLNPLDARSSVNGPSEPVRGLKLKHALPPAPSATLVRASIVPPRR